jgi:hypothetical protein
MPDEPYGIEYTHRVLWRIAGDQAAIAAARERDWFGPSLVAMVFAFHTVEAFVNFAGEVMAPDTGRRSATTFDGSRIAVGTASCASCSNSSKSIGAQMSDRSVRCSS